MEDFLCHYFQNEDRLNLIINQLIMVIKLFGFNGCLIGWDLLDFLVILGFKIINLNL